eukprot:jgi/Psemu1/206453/e_gw1.408.5.1
MSIEPDIVKSIVGTFDYVIVGAGPSALGILRGILDDVSRTFSTNEHEPSFSIAIVERGLGPPHDESTYSPRKWFDAANPKGCASKSVKLFPSDITGRVIDIPCGSGLGGSSNVNACLCLPPLERDLESWPEPYKSSLRSSATNLKSTMEGHQVIHHTSMGNAHNPFSQTDSRLQFCATTPTTVKWDEKTGKLVRKNYYDALLEPLLKQHPDLKKYLHWFRGYEAQRLLLNDDTTRVIGVECISTSNDHCPIYREIHATRRVILCAGAIGTPALLLVSDLGDKEPLLGVGKNLQDQALLARVFMKAPSNEDGLKSPNGVIALGHLKTSGDNCERKGDMFQIAITDSLSDTSLIPSILATALRWKFRNKMFMDLVEILFVFVRAILTLGIAYTPLGFILDHMTTTTLIFLMHPLSKGSVTLSPKEVHTATRKGPKRLENFSVRATPNYLDDPRDVKALKNAWDTSERVILHSSFELFPSPIFSALKLFRTKTYWFEIYCRYFLLPYYHYSGTCAMQASSENEENPYWVVDLRLKLRGHDGLYICDASVFPSLISNPPALTCAALGYEFSRIILLEDRINDKKER